MIIKNILPISYKTELENLICGDSFPWYWNNSTQSNKVNNKEDIFFQLTHKFYQQQSGGISSNLYQNILPIIFFFEKETGFKVKSIDRIKANLLTKLNATNEEIKSCVHRDVGASDIKDISQNEQYKNYVSFIYYVTDSDGDTVIYDNNFNEAERASPLAGDLVWFKSTLPHHATPPQINKRRVVINFVLELE